MDPATGPAVGGPGGEVDHAGGRPLGGHLRQRLELPDVDLGLVRHPDHPPADAATVEVDADDRPDAHLVPERVRDQVVEGLLDRGQVRQDPGDQRPSADFRSSTLEVASQVNSFSLRPKCPYAAVFL
jgi:hypothetical protein